jgi:hypothetical protein
MENKPVYLCCSSAPAIFFLIIVFTGFAAGIVWVVLFLRLLVILVKERKEIKNFFAKHKRNFIFLAVLTLCFLGSYFLGLIKQIDFYPINPIFWSLVFLAFFGKTLVIRLWQGKIVALVIFIFIIVILFFSVFVYISKFSGYQEDLNEEKANSDAYVRMLNCEKSCSPQDQQCLSKCYELGPSIGLGCGDPQSLY